jgi:hypothetical protein
MQSLMKAKRFAFCIGLVFVAGQGSAGESAASTAEKAVCTGKVEMPRQCHWIAGQMAIFNGTPAIRITQQGSHQVYAVEPSEHEWMPASLKSSLTRDNTVQADFRICPIDKSQPHGLREVCVDEVKHVKVIGQP